MHGPGSGPGSPDTQRVALHKGTLLFEGQAPPPAGEHWGEEISPAAAIVEVSLLMTK